MNPIPLWQDALSWVLTYLAHSTVLLAVAWLAVRCLGSERWRARERIWKTAVVGGILTATLQVGLDFDPLAGRIALASPDAGIATSSAGAAGTAAAGAVRLAEIPLRSTPESLFARLSWQRFLLGAWIAGSVLGVLLLFLAWRRIADFLAGRRLVRDGPAPAILERLSRSAGRRRAPRLTASHRLRSPATVGVFLPQICVPYRALTELPPDQQEALLAHELAHILRRDPLWFLLLRLIERTLFFQPLNRVAARECQTIAEFLCDDWAAQRTRHELSLVRCLTEVATWVLDVRPVVAVVPMASRNSRLASRIARLLDEERQPQDHRSRPVALAFSGAVLLGALLAMPGVASTEPPAPEVRRPRPVAPTPAAGAEIAELIELLDAELDALSRDVEDLGAQLEVHGVSSRQADSYRRLGECVIDLRGRRAQLRRLVPALLVERAGRSDPSPTPAPDQAQE